MLIDKIKDYYEKRQLLRPNIWEALGWATTELGEVYEVLLSKKNWVRNNPEDHPQPSVDTLAEELGDVIFMLVVAGIVEGVDPIEALEKKMQRKLSLKTATGVSQVTEMWVEDNHGRFEGSSDV